MRCFPLVILVMLVIGTPVLLYIKSDTSRYNMSLSKHGKNKDSCQWLNCHDMQYCADRLRKAALRGYPWSYKTQHFGDPTWPIKEVCDEFQQYSTCLSDTQDDNECLLFCTFPVNAFYLKMTFEFLCNVKDIDQMMRSLQRLQSTRVLGVMMFHIGNNGGSDLLNELIQRWNSVWINILNDHAMQSSPAVPPLLCLTGNERLTYVRPVVVENCGEVTADFVESYLSFQENYYQDAFRKLGFNTSNFCDGCNALSLHEKPTFLAMSTPLKRPPIDSETGAFVGMLARISDRNSLLETAYGKKLLDYLTGPRVGLCTHKNLYIAYTLCVLASNGGQYKTSTFNVLQYAHPLFSWLPPGTQCTSLSSFVQAWDYVRAICGPLTRGYEHHYTLFVEGCYLQDLLDIRSCEWQDVLFPYYIKADNLTAWPVPGQPPGDPMWLDRGHYNGSDLASNIVQLLDILAPGVKKIEIRCGEDLAQGFMDLFTILRYAVRDAIVLYDWVNNITYSHTGDISDWLSKA